MNLHISIWYRSVMKEYLHYFLSKIDSRQFITTGNRTLSFSSFLMSFSKKSLFCSYSYGSFGPIVLNMYYSPISFSMIIYFNLYSVVWYSTATSF
jgi:hypothetical protein